MHQGTHSLPSCACVLLEGEIVASCVLPFLSAWKTCLCTVLNRLKSPHKTPRWSGVNAGTSSTGWSITCAGTHRTQLNHHKCWDSGAPLKDIKIPFVEVALVQAWGLVCCARLPGVPVWKSPENVPWVQTAAASVLVVCCTLSRISALIPQLHRAFKAAYAQAAYDISCNRH